jgi:endonuclease/exonuclease/phosphatase family metal-dependent hydrolase
MDRHWTGAPQFLLGDFNGDLDCDACRELTKRGPVGGPPPLADAWETAARREGPEHTCDGGGGIRVGSCPGRTDHILYRSARRPERVVTAAFPTEKPAPSDHFPVGADFSLAPATAEAIAAAVAEEDAPEGAAEVQWTR